MTTGLYSFICKGDVKIKFFLGFLGFQAYLLAYKIVFRIKMMNLLEVYITYSSNMAETYIGWYNLFARTGGPCEIT
jgi:hypothetical protein